MEIQEILKNKKVIVWILMGVAVAYIWFEPESISKWIPVVSLLVGAFILYDFVDAKDIVEKEENIGTPGPFVPPTVQRWDHELDPDTGEFVPKQSFAPPMMNPNRERKRFVPYR